METVRGAQGKRRRGRERERKKGEGDIKKKSRSPIIINFVRFFQRNKLVKDAHQFYDARVHRETMPKTSSVHHCQLRMASNVMDDFSFPYAHAHTHVRAYVRTCVYNRIRENRRSSESDLPPALICAHPPYHPRACNVARSGERVRICARALCAHVRRYIRRIGRALARFMNNKWCERTCVLIVVAIGRIALSRRDQRASSCRFAVGDRFTIGREDLARSVTPIHARCAKDILRAARSMCSATVNRHVP